jgi:LmbE family N-acetylglucosaminyl deacetylase
LSGERVGSVFLSPHFDDVALSCGGTAALAATNGTALVVTVFAGPPPGDLNAFAQFQHDRWGTRDETVNRRRAEDSAAMRALGATARWLDFPDAIYRGELYLSDDELFGQVKPGDAKTLTAVREAIGTLIEIHRPSILYAPLGVGGHVDHRMTRDAALACRPSGVDLVLYEDFPYAATVGTVERWVADLPLDLSPRVVDVTRTMSSRIRAIEAYASQLPTIFRHHGPWESVVRDHALRLSELTGGYAERFWRVVDNRV